MTRLRTLVAATISLPLAFGLVSWGTPAWADDAPVVKAKPGHHHAHKKPADQSVAAKAPAPDKVALPPAVLAKLVADAEAGKPDAQANFGRLLHEGIGIPRDEVKAAEWFRKAADQGSADGMADLGYLYLTGSGVAVDMAKAMELTNAAANLGSVVACHNLGMMYFQGQGVASDPAEAARWLGKAAELGYPPAMFNLGLLYIMGQGMPSDSVAAMKWLTLAANRGDDSLRARAIEKMKTLSAAIGPDMTHDGLEAAKLWMYSHT